MVLEQLKSSSNSQSLLPTAVFILSCGRSGSTLFRTMLGGAPELFCPPELNLLQYKRCSSQSLRHAWGLLYALQVSLDSHVEACQVMLRIRIRNEPVTEAYRLLQQLISPRILVDKSPEYGKKGQYIYQQMEQLFFKPRYLWLVRHPVAVIDSFDRRRSMTRHLPFQNAEEAWYKCNLEIWQFFASVETDRYFRLTFEDLVTDPIGTMQKVANFLQLPYSSAMVTPYDGLPERHFGGWSHQILNGDPWFSERGKIQPELAESWKRSNQLQQLHCRTIRLAESLGYDMSSI